MAIQVIVRAGKAASISDTLPVSDTRIEIAGRLPEFRDASGLTDMAAWDAYCADQARAIEEALYNALPGGTYDRLLGKMLARKASHFCVSHAR